MNTLLKQARISKGMTQKEIAKIVGLSELGYQNYEYGTRVPNARTAILIAQALNTTVEELWGLTPASQATLLV